MVHQRLYLTDHLVNLVLSPLDSVTHGPISKNILPGPSSL